MRAYTTTDVAEILGVSRGTVTKLVDSGRLEGHRDSTSRRQRCIYIESFIEFLEARNIPYKFQQDKVYVEKVCTTGEAKKLSGMTLRSIMRLFDCGELEGFRISGYRYIFFWSLINFLERNHMETTALLAKSRKKKGGGNATGT